jgi:hypothetical protein
MESLLSRHVVCQTFKKDSTVSVAEIDRKRDELVAKGLTSSNRAIKVRVCPLPDRIAFKQCMRRLTPSSTHNSPPYQATNIRQQKTTAKQLYWVDGA